MLLNTSPLSFQEEDFNLMKKSKPLKKKTQRFKSKEVRRRVSKA